MARRLSTFVHVDGIAYGPDSEVPEEVAERITAPGVWADSDESLAARVGVLDPDQGNSPPVGPTLPARGDNKAAWVEYRVAQGMAREDAEKLTKDELIAAAGPGTSS